jgi:hypothetical protein
MWGKELGNALEQMIIFAAIGMILSMALGLGGIFYLIWWVFHHVQFV